MSWKRGAIADGFSHSLAPHSRTLGKDNMALYEHVLIARPDISPAQVETLMEELSEFLGKQGGTVAKTEYWGLRNLSYPINKQRKGHYALFNVDAPAAAIHELERQHRLSDDIMRYMTVKVDDLEEGPSAMMSRKDRGPRRD
ncbi:MAG: 30S ribosomal protein S6 [Henriciella sp.]|jgi:small subunit ribosomal protein S6|nr:30S ribosomal protein S6 [Henriciella sp.]